MKELTNHLQEYTLHSYPDLHLSTSGLLPTLFLLHALPLAFNCLMQ